MTDLAAAEDEDVSPFVEPLGGVQTPRREFRKARTLEARNEGAEDNLTVSGTTSPRMQLSAVSYPPPYAP